MIKTFLNWVRQVVARLFGKTEISGALGTDAALSAKMSDAIDLWYLMYTNNSGWLSPEVRSLQLPAAIAGEFARLVTLEMKTEISGSARADFLNESYKDFLEKISKHVEYGCAVGGMAFKPYPVAGGRLGIDCTPAGRFYPTDFDGTGNISGAVFIDRVTIGQIYYTRFESHHLTKDGLYEIRNLAYRSSSEEVLGSPTPLTAVRQWADLQEELTLRGIKRPLFGYFTNPQANNIDPDSPLGVSVYSRAVNLIRQADEQWDRIQWEYKGSELAVDISDRAFKLDPVTGDPIVPKNEQRLFRPACTGTDEKPLYEVFSPEIRADPLFTGLNNILKRIEFNAGLAYGTLSDPQQVDKTAEEIKSSKQRSYSTVSKLQRSLEKALGGLIYAMDVWATLNNLAPAGKYETTFEWDDSIVTDTDKEFNQRLQLTAAGIDRPDEMRQWYHGETEDEAKANLPDTMAGV